MNPTNRDKDIEIDESILDQEPPNINEPQTENTEPKEEEVIEETVETEVEDKEVITEDKDTEKDTEEKDTTPVETEDQRESRYKAQQTEAQIQAAKNRDLINKVEEAAQVGDPTIDELKSYVRSKGSDWDELTTFEQAMAKDTYISNKRFNSVYESVQSTKKIDEWATKVDTYIDSTEDKPEYIKLSGHEADFRKYCMSDAHRGTPVDVLLGAFLYNLPEQPKKRATLFNTKGGGEKEKNVGKITDTDTLINLRNTNPREYARQLKNGNVVLDA